MPPEKTTISDYPIKPRRTKGTYSYQNRNRFAAAALLVSSLIGVGYFFLPSTRKISAFIDKQTSTSSEEFKRKRRLLSPFSNELDVDGNQIRPALFDTGTSKDIRLGLAINDPKNIKPAQ